MIYNELKINLDEVFNEVNKELHAARGNNAVLIKVLFNMSPDNKRLEEQAANLKNYKVVFLYDEVETAARDLLKEIYNDAPVNIVDYIKSKYFNVPTLVDILKNIVDMLEGDGANMEAAHVAAIIDILNSINNYYNLNI